MSVQMAENIYIWPHRGRKPVLYKIKLKNSEDHCLIDDTVYEHICSDRYLQELGFLEGLRQHSSGVAVFQKLLSDSSGRRKMITIYLHRHIAERFLPGGRNLKLDEVVRFRNGQKLDCRLSNLVWTTRKDIARQRKSHSNSGYKGVYKEYNRYRAVITVDQKNIHLGMFATAQEAAKAYNRKAVELYGQVDEPGLI